MNWLLLVFLWSHYLYLCWYLYLIEPFNCKSFLVAYLVSLLQPWFVFWPKHSWRNRKSYNHGQKQLRHSPKKTCFVKHVRFSIFNFYISTPSPTFSILSTWQCQRSVFQHWKGGEGGVKLSTERRFLKLRKDADRKRLFCSTVSTLLSLIVAHRPQHFVAVICYGSPCPGRTCCLSSISFRKYQKGNNFLLWSLKLVPSLRQQLALDCVSIE